MESDLMIGHIKKMPCPLLIRMMTKALEAECIAMRDMNGKLGHVPSVPYLPRPFEAELQSRWGFGPRPRSPEVLARYGSESRCIAPIYGQ